MQYQGGKNKAIGANIADIINLLSTELSINNYIEPFAGSLGVTHRVEIQDKLVNDIFAPLINMHKYIYEYGFKDFPDVVTKELYEECRNIYKRGILLTPAQVFIGFACSFGAMFYNTYASDKRDKRDKRGNRNYYHSALKAYQQKISIIKSNTQNIKFSSKNYRYIRLPQKCIVYCDPPYINTTGYNHLNDSFNHREFYQWIRLNSTSDHIIIFSEITAPKDFKIIYQEKIVVKKGIIKSGKRVEKLFVHESQHSVVNDILNADKLFPSIWV